MICKMFQSLIYCVPLRGMLECELYEGTEFSPQTWQSASHDGEVILAISKTTRKQIFLKCWIYLQFSVKVALCCGVSKELIKL